MFKKIKKTLCTIGIHDWDKTRKVSHGFSSNVYDSSKKCKRCLKIKKWIETKK